MRKPLIIFILVGMSKYYPCGGACVAVRVRVRVRVPASSPPEPVFTIT